VRANLVAREFRGEALAEDLLASTPGVNRRALVLRALVARDALPDALRAAGWEVDVVAAYETRAAPPVAFTELARRLDAGEIDAVTFTSSSTAENFCAALGAASASLLAKTRVACIGPVTRAAAERLGIRVDVEASPFTVPALVDALEKSFA
jgi:uroporphyrinogen III methyltransferase/synthase